MGIIGRTLNAFRFWASGTASHLGSWFLNTLNTNINWKLRAGKVYDNAVVLSAILWFWRNIQFPQIQEEEQTRTVKGESKWLAVQDSPFVTAIESGNQFYDDSVLWFGTLISWYVDGNAYWFKVRSDAGLVVGYVYIPHMWIEPRADWDNPDGTKLITYYLYTIPGGSPVPILPRDIVHFRHGINPENPMLGMAPISASHAAICTENQSDRLTAALVFNGGIVPIVLSPKDGATKELTPEKTKQTLDKWKDRTTGDEAGLPMYIPIPVDVQKVGLTPDELVIDKTRAIGVTRILAPLGLTDQVLGLPSDSKTYANYKEANEAAHEQGLLPVMRIMGKQLTHQTLRTDFKAPATRRVGWDLSQVRALQEDEDKKATRWAMLYDKGGVKRKHLLQAMGLEFDETLDDIYKTDIQVSLAKEKTAQMQSQGQANTDAAAGKMMREAIDKKKALLEVAAIEE